METLKLGVYGKRLNVRISGLSSVEVFCRLIGKREENGCYQAVYSSSIGVCF